MTGEAAVTETGGRLEAAMTEVRKAVIGQERPLEMLFVGVLAGGHVLLEGVPGPAKTLMVRALARALGGTFGRIQFTPDLMPSDITGTRVFNLRSNEFELRKGPIFCDFLLADEINRSPAKTQAALLEAMQERQATIDGVANPLPSLFTVFATQNPIEFEGTYPLPEAQRDRFLLKVNLDYPTPEEEERVLALHHQGGDPHDLDGAGVKTVLTPEDSRRARAAAQAVRVEPPLFRYIRSLVGETRKHDGVLLGGGPRASVALLRAGKALAILRARDFLIPDDVRDLLPSVLSHRIVFRPEAEIEGLTVADLVAEILKRVEVPR